MPVGLNHELGANLPAIHNRDWPRAQGARRIRSDLHSQTWPYSHDVRASARQATTMTDRLKEILTDPVELSVAIVLALVFALIAPLLLQAFGL